MNYWNQNNLKMQNLDCSIIIVNYNTCTLTLECVESIRKFSTGFTYEIIVVDNASSDESSIILPQKENIRFIQSGRNLGFGFANNLGAKSAKGKFLFLLNSDTILLENSIKKMLDFYVENQNILNIGALGCILTDKDGHFINSGGFFPKAKNYIKTYFGKNLKEFEISTENEFQEIDFVTGADLMISKQIYEEVDGFDEKFFLYYEETDLQKRLTRLGYRNYIVTTTKIIHLEGGSDLGTTVSNFKRTVIHQSRNRYLKKHDRENYYKYIFLDFFATLGRLANKQYTTKEKFAFLKANFKSYF